MKDFRNVDIQTGDVIAYPGRRGSALWMTEAVVEKIGENGELLVRPVGLGRRSTIRKVSLVAVLGR